MTASTPMTSDDETPPQRPGLSEEDRALLAADVPAGQRPNETPEPEPIDWEAAVMRIADRSRPHRQAQQAARDRRERILREQRAERTRVANRERSAAQVPARYRSATVDHPAVADWVTRTVRSGVTGGADGLVLNGPVGCGKTWQAYGAWTTVAQRTGCRAVAVPVPAFLDSLRPGRTPLVPLEDAERADLLLLDDLAGERDSEWTAELVYRLIDARWNAVLPTIVTVNAPGTVIRDRLGARVASRLNGLGRIVTWPADAPDLRVTARPE
jgi:DNA replication protein DnaC